MPLSEIQAILVPYGRQSAAAKALAINPRTVRRWRAGIRSPSPEMTARLLAWAASLSPA